MRHLFALLLACLLAAPAFAVDDFANPETTTRKEAPTKAVRGEKFMVSAANPHAVRAGVAVLKAGGNAVDAAIATQMVLNVVEPQSSGIGGGGFMLYFDAATQELHVYDGRETAPKAANERLFLGENGQPLPFMEAVKGGSSVGTPGLLKMLDHAHGKHGKLAWKTLFADAIRLSSEGFAMSPRLHQLLQDIPHVHAFPASVRPFINEGNALKAIGEPIINESLSESLILIANEGINPFYDGVLTREIVNAVQQSPIRPGVLASVDFAEYEVRERDAICTAYRVYKVCSMPPPSSGGITILQALEILEALPVDIAGLEPLSVDAVHYFAEASKLAYADRNHYIADPDFAAVPTEAMLDEAYLARRAKLVSGAAMEKAPPGVPQSGKAVLESAASKAAYEGPSTTHISVVDAKGNAVSMTTSIEQGFGSGLSAHGFLLNNQLTDFSFSPTLPNGQPHPNRVQPGKRPRSSMSPTMVFDANGELLLVIGSPGGARIIEYVLQSLIATLDWEMGIQQAINLPHYLNMNGPTELETGVGLESLQDALTVRGHEVKLNDTPSSLQGIMHVGAHLEGGADPRREGIALGE